MNILAIDIGNTNITVGLFVDDSEKFIIDVPGDDVEKLADVLIEGWQQIPFVEGAAVKLRDGTIVVSSVKPEWTQVVKDVCKDKLGEKVKIIGIDVPLPIETSVDDRLKVGTDRVVAAAAAFAVVEDAVVVADFGTAVTIDLVDEDGVFLGGVIAPGFEVAAKALSVQAAQLPLVKVQTAKDAIGANTNDAINAGLYYSAVGLLKTVTESFAGEIGRWPQTIVTGGAAEIIKKDCDFVDSWVPNLVVRGVVLAYKKHLEDQIQQAKWEQENKKK